ncbi:ATP-dependent DNA ligase [Bradyrhizobium cenepequi]
MLSNPIYKRDTAGKIRTWQFEVDGEKFRTIAGIQGGSLVTSAWTVCGAKNAGKANYTNAYDQAIAEATAEERKKLKREYRKTIAELDSVMKGPMLAATYKAGLKFPVFSQPKLDGIRALITKDGAFTRELQPHFNCEHILKELAPLFVINPTLVFDGELYNHDLKDNFNRICQLVRKQTVTDEQHADIERLVQFHVYDMPSHRPFDLRAMDMAGGIDSFFLRSKHLRLVRTTFVGTQELLDELNGEYTSQGYEGQMIRLTDKPYEWDTRSKALLKRKEFDTAEFRLTGISQGEGNWAGYAKRIEFDIGDGRMCGAGVKGDQDFTKELWRKTVDGNALPFSQVTVQHFKTTPDGMPRFPVAIDFHNGRTD